MRILQLIRDIFPLRSCLHILDEKNIAKGKYRLCLDYHIKNCAGPFRGFVNPEQYSKGHISSELDNIKGIGVATAKALMHKFKSLKKIKEASLEELTETVGKAKARLPLNHFSQPQDN